MCFHHWHKVCNSERKVQFNNRCKLSYPYESKYGYKKYIFLEKCCLCNKIRVKVVKFKPERYEDTIRHYETEPLTKSSYVEYNIDVSKYLKGETK